MTKEDIYGPRNFARGVKVAHSFGAEFQANPGSDKQEYLDSSAFYFRDDVEEFRQLTPEERRALLVAFTKGIKAERAHQ